MKLKKEEIEKLNAKQFRQLLAYLNNKGLASEIKVVSAWRLSSQNKMVSDTTGVSQLDLLSK